MKIVYLARIGRLKEGLEKLGHEVTFLHFEEGKTLNQLLAPLFFTPDLVILEFFSDKNIPKEIAACQLPMAAYFIDSPLNSFWQIPLSSLFDYVFVDQLSSQKEFEKRGIKAVWLPLCACESDFRDVTEKKFFLSFVGTVNKERIKRNNIIEYIKSHRAIDQFSNLSEEQMLDTFSQSHVTLNENLFDGLTLRVFQGLAAGCLVFTEKRSLGLEEFFEEEKHIACYEPSTLLGKLDDIKERSEYWSRVALAGQKECREKHMSVHRAQALLHYVENSSLYFSSKSSGAEALLSEAEADYMFCLRFGGSHYDSLAKCFKFLETENEILRAKVTCLFAKEVVSRTGDLKKATKLLESEVKNRTFPQLFLLLAQIYYREKQYNKTVEIIETMFSLFPEEFDELNSLLDETRALQLSSDEAFFSTRVLLLISQCYAQLGSIDQIGFIFHVPHIFYENATSLAIEAWRIQPSSAILEALFFYASKGNYHEGELLPYFLEGIERALATNAQIIKTSEIALSYYQKELSKGLVEAVKVYIKNNVENIQFL